MTWRRSALPLALLPILLLAGCGGGNAAAPPQAVLVPVPQTAPARPVVRAAPGRLTVDVTRPVRVHDAPGGRVVGALEPRTMFGSATVVPVVARRGNWLGVIASALPNGRIGWIAASSRLVAYRTTWSVVASLSRREVVVRRSGRVVQRFRVAVGGPSTPTPTGRFAVTDKLLTDNPSSPYGCCILALSAHQPNTPQGWGGGDRVAIHATNLPETIGTAASLGCLRAPAEEARRLVRTVPLGTVVRIRA
jgi:lipoprotein-anchoring transpeptidase ErfK/SrfK